jgi:hypothetical protein
MVSGLGNKYYIRKKQALSLLFLPLNYKGAQGVLVPKQGVM